MIEGTPTSVRAARVRRPHGLRGEVRVESFGGDARRFRRGMRLSLDPGPRELTVRSARDLGGGELLLGFDGIDDPEAAATLRGAYLCVTPDRARRLPPGEWFVWQLVGLAAVDPSGRKLGRVSDVESGSAHDILVVDGPTGERRFPMVSAFVAEVNLDSGKVVLTPWEEEEREDEDEGGRTGGRR
ncbi:MAG: ribosome maturation factor RimM [Candidatus Dormiibacterota bacterium]